MLKSLLARKAVAIPAVAVASASVITAAVFSSALFTDQQAVPNNTLTTGTIDVVATPASSLLTLSGMMPGDVVVAPLTVKNNGTADMRYALSTTATNTDTKGLAQQVKVDVKTGVTTCTAAGFGGSGTAVGTQQTLDTFAIGSATQGAQAGDRSLTAGAQEILCIQASLPISATNAVQGATTTATFTVDAEQTKNN